VDLADLEDLEDLGVQYRQSNLADLADLEVQYRQSHLVVLVDPQLLEDPVDLFPEDLEVLVDPVDLEVLHLLACLVDPEDLADQEAMKILELFVC
jgi:hypothetical protein